MTTKLSEWALIQRLKMTRSTWCNMHTRCYNKKHSGYKWYGRRGIQVCERWRRDPTASHTQRQLGFVCFIEDMGLIPDNAQLGRIDHKKDYSPENCRWEKWPTSLKSNPVKLNGYYMDEDEKKTC